MSSKAQASSRRSRNTVVPSEKGRFSLRRFRRGRYEQRLQNQVNVYSSEAITSNSSDIWMACQTGDIAYVHHTVQHHPELLHLEQAGRSPLYYACANNHVAVAALLLEAGCSDTKDNMCEQATTSHVLALLLQQYTNVEAELDATEKAVTADFSIATKVLTTMEEEDIQSQIVEKEQEQEEEGAEYSLESMLKHAKTCDDNGKSSNQKKLRLRFPKRCNTGTDAAVTTMDDHIKAVENSLIKHSSDINSIKNQGREKDVLLDSDDFEEDEDLDAAIGVVAEDSFEVEADEDAGPLHMDSRWVSFKKCVGFTKSQRKPDTQRCPSRLPLLNRFSTKTNESHDEESMTIQSTTQNKVYNNASSEVDQMPSKGVSLHDIPKDSDDDFSKDWLKVLADLKKSYEIENSFNVSQEVAAALISAEFASDAAEPAAITVGDGSETVSNLSHLVVEVSKQHQADRGVESNEPLQINSSMTGNTHLDVEIPRDERTVSSHTGFDVQAPGRGIFSNQRSLTGLTHLGVEVPEQISVPGVNNVIGLIHTDVEVPASNRVETGLTHLGVESPEGVPISVTSSVAVPTQINADVLEECLLPCNRSTTGLTHFGVEFPEQPPVPPANSCAALTNTNPEIPERCSFSVTNSVTGLSDHGVKALGKSHVSVASAINQKGLDAAIPEGKAILDSDMACVFSQSNVEIQQRAVMPLLSHSVVESTVDLTPTASDPNSSQMVDSPRRFGFLRRNKIKETLILPTYEEESNAATSVASKDASIPSDVDTTEDQQTVVSRAISVLSMSSAPILLKKEVEAVKETTETDALGSYDVRTGRENVSKEIPTANVSVEMHEKPKEECCEEQTINSVAKDLEEVYEPVEVTLEEFSVYSLVKGMEKQERAYTEQIRESREKSKQNGKVAVEAACDSSVDSSSLIDPPSILRNTDAATQYSAPIEDDYDGDDCAEEEDHSDSIESTGPSPRRVESFLSKVAQSSTSSNLSSTADPVSTVQRLATGPQPAPIKSINGEEHSTEDESLSSDDLEGNSYDESTADDTDTVESGTMESPGVQLIQTASRVLVDPGTTFRAISDEIGSILNR